MSKQKVTSSDILRAVDVVVNKRIDELELDKTIIATIDKQLTPGKDGSHRVKYAGGYFTAYANAGVAYAPQTTVYVQVPQNNFSNKKIIIGAASSYYSDTDIETVSTAINDYMPIGTNVLSLKDDFYAEYGYGLNSYAPYTTDENGNPLYQDTILLYDKSNNNGASQYLVNTVEFATYLKEARAIMIQADFRTALRDEQQECAGAEYGLMFDVVFKNQDGVYETQGELFDAVSKNVYIENYDTEGVLQTYDMSVYNTNVQSILNDADLSPADMRAELQSESNYINAFLDSNADRFSAQETAIFNAYKYMVLELDISNAADDNKKPDIEIYNSWFDAKLELTQEQKTKTKTLSYALNSSQMTGNPFAFGSYNTQYMIFPIDVENFEYIERIYFYEKGFIVDANKAEWVSLYRPKMPVAGVARENWEGKDIWVKNLKLFALKEISSEYGDYKFKIETPDGSIFKRGEVETLTAKAKVLYKEYNNINDDCAFYWFIKDNRVTSTTNAYYDYHGGVGWRYLGTSQLGHISSMNFNIDDNKAYENHYMCAAVYKGAAEGMITLKQYFVLYNEEWKRQIEIVSSLGTQFKFDAGTPVLTCLIDGKEELFETEETVKRADSAFKFLWMRRSPTGQVVYLNRTYESVKEEYDRTTDYKTRMMLQTQMNELRGVKYLKNDVYGNQLSYEIRYLGSDNTATFECQVYTTDKLNEDGTPRSDDINQYFAIGSAELAINNEGRASVNEYSIVIENGDQVFQYSESGVAPTFASGVTPTDFRHTDPLEIQELKAHFYTPNGIEVSEGTYSVQWQYPLTDTLITHDEIMLTDNPVTQEIDLATGQSTTFGIAPSFDYNALNNQIQCIITYAGQTYKQYTNFYFGKIGDNGTNGTDVVAKIIIENDTANVMDKYPLTAYKYDRNVYWNISGTANPILRIKLYNRSTYIESNQYENVEWDVLGGIKRSEYINLTADSSDNSKATLSLDFSNSGKNTTRYHNQIIKVSARLKSTKQTYYCYLPIIIGEYTGDQQAFIKNFESGRINIDNVAYLKQILYNADGRNPLYNRNQGIKILNIEQRKIVWKVKGNLNTNTDVPIGLLTEKDNLETLTDLVEGYGLDTVYIHPADVYSGVACDNRVEATIYVSDQDETDLNIYYDQREQLDKAYQDDISDIKERIRVENVQYTRQLNVEEREYKNKQETYKDDVDELVRIQSEHEQNLTNYETTHIANLNALNVELENRNNTYQNRLKQLNNLIHTSEQKKIVFSIPIYLALNTFGLASLNAWDGNHVDINEEDGYIVAPQIGAGKKERNNSFTGVVMGEMSEYGSDESNIGLLGLLGGRQTIFLDSQTGNAYFGLQDGVQATFNSDGSFKEYKKQGDANYDNYNEGRIELKPGGVSVIGGWRLGRSALYYTSTGVLEAGNFDSPINYGKDHVKDIGHTDQGVLLYAGTNPYISVKGRVLNKSGDISSETALNNLTPADSLELQLDPQQRSLFSIFVHQKQTNGTYKRILLSGIDNRGRFIANRIENPAPSASGNSSTSFEITPMNAFGDTTLKYVGANFEAGSSVDSTNSFMRLFVLKSNISSGDIHIDGGENNNSRIFSLHGQTINLYGGNSGSQESTTSRVSISPTEGYIGNTGAFLRLAPSGNSNTELHSVRPVDFSFGSNAYTINSGAYTLKASTLTENISGNISRNSTSGGITDIASGSITLKSQSGSGHLLTLASTSTTLGKENSSDSYLKLQSSNEGNSVLQSKGSLRLEALQHGTSGGQIYLYGHTNAENYFKTWNSGGQAPVALEIRSMSGNTLAAWNANATWAQCNDKSAVDSFREIMFRPTANVNLYTQFFLKPGSKDSGSNESMWTGAGWNMGGGLKTGWVWGTEFVESPKLMATQNASNIQFANTSISKTVGSSLGNVTKTAAGTTLYKLIEDCLYAATEAHAAAKNAYARADEAYSYAGQAYGLADSANANANNRVDWSTYNNHRHNATYNTDSKDGVGTFVTGIWGSGGSINFVTSTP